MNANDVITIAKAGIAEGGRQAAIDAVFEKAVSVTEDLPEVETKQRIQSVVDALLGLDERRALELAEQGIEEMSSFLVQEEPDEDDDEDEDGVNSSALSALEARVSTLEGIARRNGLL